MSLITTTWRNSFVRGGDVDLSEYIVRKGLNKAPKDYPDAKGQPHLVVALQI